MLPLDQRHQAVASTKENIISSYPSLWQELISDWKTDSSRNQCWMIYAANYLFRTQNIRWAIDPFTIYTRLNQQPPIDLANDLQSLNFVLLTHKHADHLDLPLIRSLAKYPICWVIPAPLLPLIADCQLDPRYVLIPRSREPIDLNGLHITPFDGLHHHTTPDGVLRGVPAMGYHVQCGDQTWLFPGDTRTHQPQNIPVFPPPNILFAHLWLGKACADMPIPPKVDDFCDFFLALNPQRLVITHLHEIGRVPNEFWDLRHYKLVKDRIHQLNPTLPIRNLQIGQSLTL